MVVFICFSLMLNDVEHLLMCILSITLYFCEVSFNTDIFAVFKIFWFSYQVVSSL